MDRLPVVWFHSMKAWFTAKIFTEWFDRHFVPEVIRYQTKELNIPHDQVRALLLLDNAPAHPSADKLVAENGRIRVMYLPPNTTALMQPMDQGVIVSTKRHYRRRFLDEVMVVLEDEEEKMQNLDTRGARTLENLRRYDMKSAIFNWAGAWKDVPSKTLENAWSHLLRGTEMECNFEGFELDAFHRRFVDAGDDVTADDVLEWLDDDGGDPGYQMLSDTEIASTSPGYVPRDEDTADTDSDDDLDDPEPVTDTIPKLSQVRDNIEALLSYVEHPDAVKEIARNDISDTLRCLRETVIRYQNRRTYRQSRIDSFFRPQTPAHRPPGTQSVASNPPFTPTDDPLLRSPSDVSLPSTSEGRRDTPTPDPTLYPLVLLREGSAACDCD